MTCARKACNFLSSKEYYEEVYKSQDIFSCVD